MFLDVKKSLRPSCYCVRLKYALDTAIWKYLVLRGAQQALLFKGCPTAIIENTDNLLRQTEMVSVLDRGHQMQTIPSSCSERDVEWGIAAA